MGSKLTVLAIQLICAGTALAQPAGDPFKRGVEAYKAGKYEEAATLLGKAYAKDQKVETLFALAQAERLAGHCDLALPHYHAVLDKTTDLVAAKAVQTNLSLCPEPVVEPVKPVVVEPTPVVVAPPPPPRIVIREVSHRDPVAATAITIGGIGMGLGVGFLLAAGSARDDAANARTLDDHERMLDRADRDQLVGMVVGGVGVVAAGLAAYRWLSGSHHAETTDAGLALVPTRSGSLLVWSSPW